MSSEFRASLRGRRSALQQTMWGRDSGGEPQNGHLPVSVTEWVNLTPEVHAKASVRIMRLAKKGDPQCLMIWRQLEKASKGRVRSKYLDNHLLALMKINWGKGWGCKIFLKTPYASLWGFPLDFWTISSSSLKMGSSIGATLEVQMTGPLGTKKTNL